MNHSKLQEIAPRWFGCGAVVLLLSACSGEHVPPRSASNAGAQTTASVVSPAAANEASTDRRDDATDVKISEELRRQCQLPEAPADAPKFNYDEAALTPGGRDTLQDVARCLAEGPMKGRTVTIIGRADPRGTEQYNQELGMDRAQATRDYLVARGVPEGQIELVSRGEGGAQGTNEASWALDRRVDIEVARSEPMNTSAESDQARATNPFVEARRIQASDPGPDHGSAESRKAQVYADQAEGGEVIATQP